MASNGATLEDEDGDYPDWIELYNPGQDEVDLSGWGLSDDDISPFRWVFPDQTVIESGGYLIVWASRKNRTDPAHPLHANFSIGKDGDTVLLTAPNGEVVDRVTWLPMPRDFSYGRKQDDPHTWTRFAVPTPGTENAGPGGHLLSETVIFSEPSRTFTNRVTVSLAGADHIGVIRYTTDGSIPDKQSALYEQPLTLTKTTLLRARIFDAHDAAGHPATRHYIRLGDDLLDRRSFLPIVVMDARGAEITPVGPHRNDRTRTPEGKPRHDGFFFLFDRDPEGVSALTRRPELAVRQGLRHRGSSSMHWPKKPYSVEFRDEYDRDTSLALLGMRPESDWVFYPGYGYDRAIIRNSLIYELSRRSGRWAPDSRFVEVYVNHDGEDLTEEDYVGVYAIIERIKQGPGRLGHHNINRDEVPPEGPIDVAVKGPWTGGYILKIDRAAVDEYEWETDRRIPDEPHSFPLVISRPKIHSLDGGPYPNYVEAGIHSRQVDYVVSYVQAFEDALVLDRDGNFQSRDYLDYIDRDSWVDHLLLNAFAKNVDGLRLSAYFHKPENQLLQAGPIWDFDRSMGSHDPRDSRWDTWYGTRDSTPYFHSDDWWDWLCLDPDFRQAFYDRWAEWRATVFSDEALEELIRAMGEEINRSCDTIESAAARNLDRWPDRPYVGNEYTNEIQRLIDWVIPRANWMDRRRQDEGMLPPPPVADGNGSEIWFESPSGGSIFFTLDGRDPRAPGGGVAGTEYTAPLSVEGPALLTARTRNAHGHWSTPTVKALGGLETRPSLIHYWNFNDEKNLLRPTYSLAEGSGLTVEPGPHTDILPGTGEHFSGENARFGDAAGSHLRVNRPLDAEIHIALPTPGFEYVVVHYETRRSSSGAGTQVIEYTVDGTHYQHWDRLTVTEIPARHTFDFSGIPEVNNNAEFGLRITFEKGHGGPAGNHRFDNITAEGRAWDAANLPPRLKEPIERRYLIENGDPAVVNLSNVFHVAEKDGVTFTAHADNIHVADPGVDGSTLTVYPLQRGNATVTIAADDHVHPPTQTSFDLLVYPSAHALSNGPYVFSEWHPDEPDGHYPEHMLFLQSEESDPGAGTPLSHAYSLETGNYHPDDHESHGYPYNNTARTRINALGEQGLSFINTGRERDLGGALMAVDTTGVTEGRVAWMAGTVTPNDRTYAIRLQYRIGTEGPFMDVRDGRDRPLEYVRNDVAGHVEAFGPVELPSEALGEPYVQLLWRYYRAWGDTGPRAELRLDDITVTCAPAGPVAHLLFDTYPSVVQSGEPLGLVVVRAVDAAGMIVTNFAGIVELTLIGDGTLSGTRSVQAVNGIAFFGDLHIGDGAGAFQLSAEAEDTEPAAGNRFTAVRLTEILLPRFIQGEQDRDGSNLNRVPYAYRLKLEGLETNTIYRYGNRVAAFDDPPDQDGAGNMIFVKTNGDAFIRNTDAPRFMPDDLDERHGTFVTDEDGTYEGWFIAEPTGNRRFDPGNTLNMRILLNDGADGTAYHHLLTTTGGVEILEFGEGAHEATGLVGKSEFDPGHFVVLYEDEQGHSRPLAATPIEMTGSDIDERYALFYEELVATNPRFWGALIPNALSSGVRRIEVRSLADGALLDASVFEEGLPGTMTADGNPIAHLPDNGSDIPVLLAQDDATWAEAINWTTDTYPDGTSTVAVIRQPANDRRDVKLNDHITIGHLIVHRPGNGGRNRIQDTGGHASLHFASTNHEAAVTVTDEGTGFVEFRVQGGVFLESDVRLTVQSTGGHAEYGGLRLRESWSGPGALIKDGPGTASLTGPGKTYTGETRIESGVLQITEPATPSASTQILVKAGAQLRLVSGNDPRIHSFGGPLKLTGRGPDSGGALRYEPGPGTHYARIAGPVIVRGDSGWHVEGSNNTLAVSGALKGAHEIAKTGDGILRLAGSGDTFTGTLRIEAGAVHLHGDLTAPVILEPGTHVSGSGTAGLLSGSGEVALESSILTADSINGLWYAFGFGRPGSPAYAQTVESGNALLRLNGADPFAHDFNAGNRVALYFDVETFHPDDVFRGGFFTDQDTDFLANMKGAHAVYYVRDSDGTVGFNGRRYSEYTGPLTFTVDTARAVADFVEGTVTGRIMRVRFQGGQLPHERWLSDNFDPEELEDPAISGPDAMPDDDGWANLAKYALGLNRTDAIEPALPRMGIMTDGETEYLTYTYRRLIHEERGVEYQVEVARELDDAWVALETLPVYHRDPPVPTGDDQTEEIRIRIPEWVFSEPLFIRLRFIPQ